MSKAADLANLIGNINAGGGGVNKNILVNGSMNVAQRGTSSTSVGGSSGYFTCDRWHLDSGASTDGRLTMTQDSSAPNGFANSLKLLVDKKLNEGLNEKQIYNYLSEKYGEWILYDPVFNENTYFLWILPILMFLIGGAIILRVFIIKKS